MNSYLLRQTSSGFNKFTSNTPTHKHTLSQQQGKMNPEDDIKTSNPNDPLLKIILFDNGNAVKDCKSVLDSFKEQNFDGEEKLSLFYQEDLSQLIDNIDLNQISLDRIFTNKFSNDITSKIKNLKLKKYNQTFQNYSKLMKHSLREHDKMKFLTQSSKINQSEDKHFSHNKAFSSKNKLKNILAKNISGSSLTVLDEIMLEKRNQLAIQSSSTINKEENDLSQIMKNRAVCQKILQEALMFQRYFDILKKEKQRVFDESLQTNTNFRSQPSQKGAEKRKYLGKSVMKNLKNKNGIVSLNLTNNSLCANPKHLRLPENASKSMNHFESEHDYNRNKYMAKMKRDKFLKQINRIHEDIVEKRNSKNNVLIRSLMEFIRNNSVSNDTELKPSKKNSRSNRNDEESNLHKSSIPKKNQKPKEISGAGLTKILRRLFLIYSFIQTEQSGSDNQCLISKQNLKTFLNDFKIDARAISQTNHKIRQILQKDGIDEFQFIQFIHVLSSLESFHFDNEEASENFVYTNINKWVGRKILHPKYEVFLSLEEERLLRKDLRKQIEKLRKLNRFEDKILKVIDIFIEQENINSLSVPHLFEDFDYVLEVLWFMNVYPTYVNKRTVRFYFEYLKEDKGSLVLTSLGFSTKKNQFAIVQNIVWLVLAKASKEQLINQPQQTKNQFNIGEDPIIISKTLDQVFNTKFRIVQRNLLQIIEAKSVSKHRNLQY